MNSKKASTPLAMHVKYRTRIGRHLSDYHEIKGKIVALSVMSKYYSKKLENFNKKYPPKSNPCQTIEEDDILPLTGTFVNIVMSYNRCFDASGGEGSRRSMKLQDDFLKKEDPSILNTHNALKGLRNKVIAHAGINDYERHEFRIGFDSNGFLNIFPADDNVYLLSSPDVEFDRMEPLLKVILKEVDSKLECLLKKVQAELDDFNKKKEIIIDKLQSSQSVTEEDLRRVRKSL